MAGETVPQGQDISFDEERCRDFLVHELGIEIARSYRYSEGIHEVRRRVKKRFGDDDYVNVMRLFDELLESDDNAAGLGDDGDLWRSWRHEYKLHKDGLEIPGAPRSQAAVASSTALSAKPKKCIPIVIPEPVDVTIEQILQSGVEQQKNRHGGVQAKAVLSQEPEGDDSTAKPALDAKGRPKRGLSLKLSGMFRREREHGTGGPEPAQDKKKQIVKSSSEKALLGLDGTCDDLDSFSEVFSETDNGFALETTTRAVVEKRHSALSLDGVDDDEEDFWNDDYDSELAEDITQILSPLEQFARTALQQHGRVSDPFADHSTRSGCSAHSGNPGLLEGFEPVHGARFGRGSGYNTPSSCYDSPQRSSVPGTPARQSPSHESPSHGNPAYGTPAPRTPVQGTSAHGSPAYDARSIKTAITTTTEREGSLRYLDYLSEEVNNDEPSSPNKRPRSPMKKMFGENGWLSRSTSSTEMSAVQPRSSSFKGRIMRKFENLSEDVSRRLPNPFAAGTAPKDGSAPPVLRISLDRLDQVRLYSELELMICVTANNYLNLQNVEGRISEESRTRVMEAWKSKGRPNAVEFRLDQASQRELIGLNFNTVRFYGDPRDTDVRAITMLNQWKAFIADLSPNNFCNPNPVVRCHLADAYRVLDLLGARITILLAFHDLQRQVLQKIGDEPIDDNDEGSVEQAAVALPHENHWFHMPMKMSRSGTRTPRQAAHAFHHATQPSHGTAQASGSSSRADRQITQAPPETTRASGSPSRVTRQATQGSRPRPQGAQQGTRTSRRATPAARLATQPRSNSVAMRSSTPNPVLTARVPEKMPAGSPIHANAMRAPESQPTEIAQPGPRVHRKVASSPGRQPPEMQQTGPPLLNAKEIRYPNERIFSPPEAGEYLLPRVYVDPTRASRRYPGE